MHSDALEFARQLLSSETVGQAVELGEARREEIDDDVLEIVGASSQAALAKGEVGTAGAGYTIGIQLARLAGDRRQEALMVLGLANAAGKAGDAKIEASSLVELHRLGTAGVDRNDPWGPFILWQAATRGPTALRQTGAVDAAGALLDSARDSFHAAGHSSGEAWTCLLLAHHHLGRPDVAFRYLQVAAHLARGAGEDDPAPPEHTLLTNKATLLGSRLLDADEPALAAEAAELALAIDPDYGEALFVLGNVRLTMLDHEGALEAFDRALACGFADARLHGNRASALFVLDRVDDALAATDAMLSDAPHDPWLRVQRGIVQTARGDLEAALAEFMAATSAAAHEPTLGGLTEVMHEPRAAPRSTPVDAASVRLFARSRTVHVLRALGRHEEARTLVGELLAGPAEQRFEGLLLEGALAEEAEAPAEAAAAYTAAAEVMPGSVAARSRLVHALIELGDRERACTAALALAHHDLSPEAVIALLSPVVDSNPNDGLARKARGFAYLEARRPAEAAADLAVAVEALPRDAQARRWRGLARITHPWPPPPDDPRRDGDLLRAKPAAGVEERMLAALADLAAAVDLDPDDHDGRETYRWLFERLFMAPQLRTRLLDTADEPHGVYRVFPELREPLERAIQGSHAAAAGGYREGLALLTEAQQPLADAGFVLLAEALVNAQLADVNLRLWEIQEAMDAVDRADAAAARYVEPLAEPVQGRLARAREHSLRAGKESLPIDSDHFEVYALGLPHYLLELRILRAETLARSGDARTAAELLQAVPDLPERVLERDDRRYAYAVFREAAKIFRDADDQQLARLFAEGMRTVAAGDAELSVVHQMEASIAMRAGDRSVAIAHYEEAHRASRGQRPEERLGHDVNLAAVSAMLGDGRRALALLDPWRERLDIATPRDRLVFHAARGRALMHEGSVPAAREEIARALELAEEGRRRLRVPEHRMTWQVETQSLYEDATVLAAIAGDTAEALALSERARSRAFLDRLVTGERAGPEPQHELAQLERALELRLDTLRAIDASVRRRGDEYVEWDVVGELMDEQLRQALVTSDDPAEARIASEALEESLASTAGQLAQTRQRLDAERFAETGAVAAEPLGLDELRAILRG